MRFREKVVDPNERVGVGASEPGVSRAGGLFLRSSVIYLAGTLGARIVSLLLLPLNTYYLTTSQYGDYDLILVLASLILPVSTLTLSSAVYRFMIVEADHSVLSRVNTNIWIGTLLGAVASTLVIIVACSFANYPWGPFLGLIVFSQSLVAVAQPMLRGFRLGSMYALSGVLAAASQGASNVVFLFLTPLKTEALLLSAVTSNVVVTVFCLVAAKVWRYFDLRLVSIRMLRSHLAFTLPLIPAALINWVNGGIGRLLLGNFHGADSLGIMAAGNRLAGLGTSVFAVLNLSMNDSVIIDRAKGNDTDPHAGFFTRAFAPIATLIVSVLLLLLPGVGLLFPWLVDAKFSEARLIMPILLVGAAVGAVADLYLSVFLSAKDSRAILASSGLGACLNVLLCFLLIPGTGIIGAAVAGLFSVLGMLCYRHLLCIRIVPVALSWQLGASLVLLVGVTVAFYLMPGLSGLVFVLGLFLFAWINARVLRAVVRLMLQSRPVRVCED